MHYINILPFFLPYSPLSTDERILFPAALVGSGVDARHSDHNLRIQWGDP